MNFWINGIQEDYNTLMPYVTVYGPKDNSPFVNINGAQKPVLMCLSEKIDDELAQRVIERRKIAPFERKDYLQNVKGFGDSNIYYPISSYIDVKGTFFHLKATASSGGVKRIIETVLNISSGNIEYWKEY
jgi:type II secretory pathway component PulK